MPSAHAQTYPSRPVTLVLGFAPGGPSDVMARIFSKKLEQVLGQPIVIENRTGAGGNIAGEMVARAAPDGYTILLANSGILAANALLYKRTGFDAERDFAPITRVGAQANVLVINPSHAGEDAEGADRVCQSQSRQDQLCVRRPRLLASPRRRTPEDRSQDRPRPCAVQRHRPGLDGHHRRPRADDVLLGVAGEAAYRKRQAARARGHHAASGRRLLPDIGSVNELAIPGFEATAWHALVAPAENPEGRRLQRSTAP